MTPSALREYLQVLREEGARSAKLPVEHDGRYVGMFEVEFAPSASVPAAALVDRDGKPIDLDEGMPELARDPIADAAFRPGS